MTHTPLTFFIELFRHVKGVCCVCLCVCVCVCACFVMFVHVLIISFWDLYLKKNSKTDNREPAVTHTPLTFFTELFRHVKGVCHCVFVFDCVCFVMFVHVLIISF